MKVGLTFTRLKNDYILAYRKGVKMIKKVFSILLVFVILSFIFAPSVSAVDDENLIDVNMSNWVIAENYGLLNYVEFVGGSENLNRIRFNASPSGEVNSITLYDVTDVLLNGKNYNFNFDALTYGMDYIYVHVFFVVRYNDGSDDDFYTLVEFGKSSTSPNYTNYNINFTPDIQNKGYNCFISFVFFKTSGSVGSNRNCNIKNLNLIEVESKETNILKRIFNYIKSIPSTIQGYIQDFKSNLFDTLDLLKNSIGGFFDNFSENISLFFTRLKNYLLWFNEDGGDDYINPFINMDEDELERSVFGRFVDWFDEKADELGLFMGNSYAFLLVLSSFTSSLPFVLSVILFGLFIHIARRLLGY